MLEYNDSPSRRIIKQAENEMAAFLNAASVVFGYADVSRVGDAWIRAMESLDWPDENHEKFFRRVTIHAIAHLRRTTARAIPVCNPLGIESARVEGVRNGSKSLMEDLQLL